MAAVPCDSTTFLFRYVGEQTDPQTDRHTDAKITILRIPNGGGEVY